MLIALLALVACRGGAHNATPAFLPSPQNGASSLAVLPEVVSTNGVATLTLTAALDPAGRPAFFWQGMEVAPTIRVHPGDQIRLHYQNNLPQTCGLGLESDSNLHFHGLTVAPVQPADEVIVTNAPPGGSFDYVVTINPDQPPGLYWYHSHPHGLTNWEVNNGMAGAIVVEGIADEIPSLAGLRERVMILTDPPTDPSVAAAETQTRIRKAQASSSLAASRTTLDADESGGNPCAAETDGTPMINGARFATIGIQPGEKQLWRILNASGHRHFDITIPGAQMQLVAQDGVPLADYAGAAPTQTVGDVVIPPAGRAEIVVTGPATPQPLVSMCYNSGPAGDANPQVVLGQLVNDNGTAATAHVAAPLGLRMKQAYRVPPPAPVAQRTIALEEDASGFYINNAAYNPSAAPSVTVQTGTTEEWTIENDTDEVHVFHLHQVHFVVESINGVANANPHWVDTVDVPPQGRGVQGRIHPSTVKILADFRDPVIRGVFLFHCHITDHEDGGMMAKIQAI